jgi:hypothetical protein
MKPTIREICTRFVPEMQGRISCCFEMIIAICSFFVSCDGSWVRLDPSADLTPSRHASPNDSPRRVAASPLPAYRRAMTALPTGE